MTEFTKEFIQNQKSMFAEYERESAQGEERAANNWNTRPIEDELRARIAELEAESERFTVHSEIERQDDKWIPEVK